MFKKYFIFLCLFFLSLVAFAQPNTTVVDNANLFQADEKQKLDTFIRSIFESGGPQIAIVTIDDLEGTPIENYTIQLAEKWKLGDAKKDNGLILAIALKNRKMRIEVGGGIEGEITDYDSNLIINKVLKPAFKQGAYYEGVLAFLNVVTDKFQIELKEQGFKRTHHYQSTKGSHFILIFIILIIIIVLSRFNRFGSMTSYNSGYGRRSHYGGGYYSSSGGSGSSWSGGGGGFSGGGSSGDW